MLTENVSMLTENVSMLTGNISLLTVRLPMQTEIVYLVPLQDHVMGTCLLMKTVKLISQKVGIPPRYPGSSKEGSYLRPVDFCTTQL